MVQGQHTTYIVNNSVAYHTGFTIKCRVDRGAMYKEFSSSCSTAARQPHPPSHLSAGF